MIRMDSSTLPSWDDQELQVEAEDALQKVLDIVEQIEHPQVRLDTLNAILDGKVARKLEGERQKLDPWGRWMHSTYLDASTGHPEWRESAETRRVISDWKNGEPVEWYDENDIERRLDANLIVSDTGVDNKQGERLHIPMFDVDLPMRVVPSTNPGKGHLYINKPMTWENIRLLLDALVAVNIVHRNYREHSVERGSTTLRPAFVDKPKMGWNSDGGQVEPDWAMDPMVPKYATPGHSTDGSPCWCDPDVEVCG